MSLLLEPDSAEEPEESQNQEDDFQSSSWRNTEIDENKTGALKVIEEIVNSTDNLPDQIVEVAKAILEISSRINATMISCCVLARIN